MNRLAMVLFAVLLFAGSTWYGYRLSEESFAWLDAAPAAPGSTNAPTSTGGTSPLPAGVTTQQATDYLKKLSPTQLACLTKAVGADRVAAALKGQLSQLTPQETIAVAQCLK